MTRIGDKYKLEIGPDGRTRLIEDTKASEAKLDESTRIAKRSNRGKARPASRRKADSVKKVDHG